MVGDDQLPCFDDPGSPTANIIETKLLLNSVIPDTAKGVRFMSIDLKDHFLASPMDKCEYVQIYFEISSTTMF